jgi:HEAT repeat protein
VKNRLQQHLANLGHEDDKVATWAQELIRRYYLHRAVPQLIPLCESPDATVRLRAGWLLGLSKVPEAYQILVQQTSDADPRVRYDAAMALGKLGDLRALDLLFACRNRKTRWIAWTRQRQWLWDKSDYPLLTISRSDCLPCR